MASAGTFVSGLGHVGLIGWLILGWGLTSEPLTMDTIDVSVISGEEFDQMRARAMPEPGEAEPDAPVPPVIVDTPPVAPVNAQPAEPVPAPAIEAPIAPPPPPALPETPVVDALPVAPAPPVAPPPTPDLDVSAAPTPPQAPTVASTISEAPSEDAQIDDVVRDAVVPDDTAAAEAVVEEQEPTAPEETTTQIVIEDAAPTTSVRPSTRPSRPQPVSQAQTDTTQEDPAPQEPAETAPQDDVAAALDAALAGAATPAVAAGRPMTGAERDSFRISVNRCWNVDPGSVAARVTVEVGFSLDRDGSVRGNEVRLISSQGDTSAVDTAFQAARRAILRCQSGGYQLPADKYDQWEEVVITFDPSGMRLR